MHTNWPTTSRLDKNGDAMPDKKPVLYIDPMGELTTYREFCKRLGATPVTFPAVEPGQKLDPFNFPNPSNLILGKPGGSKSSN